MDPARPMKGSITVFFRFFAALAVAWSLGSTLAYADQGARHFSFLLQPSSHGTAGEDWGGEPGLIVLNERGGLDFRSLQGVEMAAYADAACLVPASGHFSGSHYPWLAFFGLVILKELNHTGIGKVYIKVWANGVSAACSGAVTVAPGAADHLIAVSGDGQSATASTALKSPIQVRVVDKCGNPVSGYPLSVTPIRGGGNVSPSVAASNASGLATANLTLGPTVGTQAFQVARASGAALRGTPATITFSETATAPPVVDNSPVSLSLIGPASQVSGNCSSMFTVRALNRAGQAASVASPLTLVLSDVGNGTVFSDAACTQALSSIKIASGANQTLFYLKDTRAETLVLQASAPDVTSSTTIVDTVVAGPAFTLGYAAALSPAVVAGQSWVVQPDLRVLDTYGNRVSAGGYSISLQATQDPQCQIPATGDLSGTLNPVVSSLGKSVFDQMSYAQAGVFYLRASADGLASACSTAITVSPAAASKISIVEGDHQTGVVHSALSVSSQVKVTDSFGNAVSGAGLAFEAVNGAASPSMATSDAQGLASTVLTLGDVPGTYLLRVSGTDSGGAWVDSQNPPSVAFSETANAGPVASLILAGPVTQDAGSCAGPFTLHFKDAYGNPATVGSTQAIGLSGAGAGFFYSDPTCANALASAEGASGAVALAGSAESEEISFYFSGNRAQNLLFTVSTGATPGDLTSALPHAVQPGTPSLLTKVRGDEQRAAAGTAVAVNPTVQVMDVYGNGVSGAILNFAASSGGGVVGSTWVVTDDLGQGSTSFVLGPISGLQTVSAALSSASGVASVTFNETAAPRPASALLLTGASSGVAGSCSSAVTVALLDSDRNPTAAQAETQVILSGAGAGVFYADAGCATPMGSLMIASGASSAQFFMQDLKAESLTVVAQSPSLGSSGLAWSVAPAVASRWVFNVQPSSTSTAGQALSVQPTLNAWDAFGNPATSFSGSAALAAYADASCTQLISGGLTASSNPVSANGGVVVFAGVTLSQSGVVYLSVSSPSSPSMTSSCSHAVTVSVSMSLAAGTAHTCALNNGAVKCWGSNTSGTLGNGNNTTFSTPQSVVGLGSGVTAMGSGGQHVCAARSNGVVCWGLNSSGQLGNGTLTSSNVPTDVNGIGAGITQIAGGDNHTCVLSDGLIKCWGDNTYGQLGNGVYLSSASPVSVLGLPGPAQSIAAGSSTTCAVLATGAAYCWGFNDYGQLGNGTAQNSNLPVQVQGLAGAVTAIAPGIENTCALVSGAVYCWGRNVSGQLGNGTFSDSMTPTLAVGLSARVSKLLSGGQNFSCAVLVSGAVQCWGQNSRGQLGDNKVSGAQSNVPVQVVGLTSGMEVLHAGYIHACASDGTRIKCWGWGSTGQLGNGQLAQSSVPVQVVGY